MSGPPRRKLTAIDDPLFAVSPEASPPVSATPGRRAAPPTGTAALYAELPQAEWDALARAAFELRTHKRLIVTALIAEYVDATTEDGRDRLRELLDRHR